jgi:hypothetical protein
MRLPIGGRHVLHGLALVGAVATGYAFGVTGDHVSAQQPQPVQPAQFAPAAQPQPKAPAESDHRVVAYITNPRPAPGANPLIAITREDLGEFLIARGGDEKLELLVNKKIIELEAARRGVTVTTVEVKAALEEDLRGLGLGLKDFEKHVLPRYHKTLYEWVEDVIKPRLMLSKMCQERVKVTEEDLKRSFENKYGERRQAKVICWAKEDLKAAQSQWTDARKSDADFDRIARQQADPNLASACGLVAPLGRYADAESDKVEQMLFNLKVGEMSQLFETPSGIMCLKLTAIIPPDATKTLDEKMRAALTTELRTRRTDQEVGKFFQDIKKVAQPNLLLKGPPSAAEFREGVTQILNNANVNPAGGLPPAATGGLPPAQAGGVSPAPGRP